jgi:hypothetical protein
VGEEGCHPLDRGHGHPGGKALSLAGGNTGNKVDRSMQRPWLQDRASPG